MNIELSPVHLAMMTAGFMGYSRWEMAHFNGRDYIWSGGPALTFTKGNFKIQIPLMKLPELPSSNPLQKSK